MPVLAVGAEKSFNTAMADDIRLVATNVAGAVIPNSGHWLMEEQPAVTVAIKEPPPKLLRELKDLGLI